VDAHTFAKQAKKFKQPLSACHKADDNSSMTQDRSTDGAIHEIRDRSNARSALQNTRKNCIGPFRKKGRGILTSCVVLLHDNARPHTAAHTRALLENFNWELFDHPPWSPDPAPSDYCLFTYLKNWLRPQRFSNNEELVEGVKKRLSSQEEDFFDRGT
jgi:hypothetical protein